MASLSKGTTATFVLGTNTVTCKDASFVQKVTRNPAAPGTAATSLKSLTFGVCSGASGPVTATALGLPYKATISDATGFPVLVTGKGSATPTQINLSLASSITCTYVAGTFKGKSTRDVITVTKQNFATVSTASTICLPVVSYSAKYRPVTDTSVRGSPAVFVN